MKHSAVPMTTKRHHQRSFADLSGSERIARTVSRARLFGTALPRGQRVRSFASGARGVALLRRDDIQRGSGVPRSWTMYSAPSSVRTVRSTVWALSFDSGSCALRRRSHRCAWRRLYLRPCRPSCWTWTLLPCHSPSGVRVPFIRPPRRAASSSSKASSGSACSQLARRRSCQASNSPQRRDRPAPGGRGQQLQRLLAIRRTDARRGAAAAVDRLGKRPIGAVRVRASPRSPAFHRPRRTARRPCRVLDRGTG